MKAPYKFWPWGQSKGQGMDSEGEGQYDVCRVNKEVKLEKRISEYYHDQDSDMKN